MRSSTKKELLAELQKARDEMVAVRIGIKTGHVKDGSLAGKRKRYVARLLTVIKEIEVDEIIESAKTVN